MQQPKGGEEKGRERGDEERERMGGTCSKGRQSLDSHVMKKTFFVVLLVKQTGDETRQIV